MSDPKDVVEVKQAELIAAERESANEKAIASADEPPIVARMVIEIRSDGTRTIARGAAEDASTGEKVAIQIEGTTPLALALSMMKTVATLPTLARTAMKALARDKGRRD